MSAKIIVPIVAVVCAAGGFSAGRATAPAAAEGALDSGSAGVAPAGPAATAAGSGGGDGEVAQPLPSLPAEPSAGVATPSAETLALRKRVQELKAEVAKLESRPTLEVGEEGPVHVPSLAGARAAVAKLREALAAGDSEAVRKIGKLDVGMERTHAVPELITLLEQTDSIFGKAELARLLGQLGDKRALPALQQLLENEADDTVRTAAVSALGSIPDASSVELLTKEFSRESESPMPPSLAATSLGKIGTDDAVASLKAEIAQGTNGMVRAFAVRNWRSSFWPRCAATT
jgi:hypothetical protein